MGGSDYSATAAHGKNLTSAHLTLYSEIIHTALKRRRQRGGEGEGEGRERERGGKGRGGRGRGEGRGGEGRGGLTTS